MWLTSVLPMAVARLGSMRTPGCGPFPQEITLVSTFLSLYLIRQFGMSNRCIN